MYFNLLRLYIGKKCNYMPKKIDDNAKKKNYLRGNFFYIRGKTSLVRSVSSKIRGENPRVLGALLYSKTKIILFPAKSKCVNTSSIVKMQRFAAARVRAVLYYEEDRKGL